MQGKTIIITGAANGLGAAQARLLAERGARVVLTDVDTAAGRALAASLPDALFITHDVGDEGGWADVVGTAAARFGRLDGLVNNAGIVRFASIEDCSLDDYRLHQRIMSEGTFLGCRAIIPAMAEYGGAIVNIASVNAIRGAAAIPAYSAAKGAILSLGRSIVVHCRERGYPIRLNTILPGSHATGMAAAARAIRTPLQQALADATEGKPEDVAELVHFLVSDASATINGAEIVIDKGRTVA